jgi:hypothetical protein
MNYNLIDQDRESVYMFPVEARHHTQAKAAFWSAAVADNERQKGR